MAEGTVDNVCPSHSICHGTGSGLSSITTCCGNKVFPLTSAAETFPTEVQQQESEAYQRSGRMELLSASTRLPETTTWAEVPAQLKRELMRMHTNLGHLDTAQMMRMLSRAGAKKEVARLCGLLECSTCGDLLKRRFPQAVKLGVNEYCFGIQLAVDVLSVKDAENQVHKYLNILDLGTHYQVCAYLAPGLGVTAAQQILRTFVRSWTACAGWPERVWLDLGHEFLGDFAKGLTDQGVDLAGTITSQVRHETVRRHWLSTAKASAREAFVKLDADSRIRRSVLKLARTTPGPWTAGDVVYFRREQTKGVVKWVGVARVIGLEGTQRVWIRYVSQTVLVTPQELRRVNDLPQDGNRLSSIPEDSPNFGEPPSQRQRLMSHESGQATRQETSSGSEPHGEPSVDSSELQQNPLLLHNSVGWCLESKKDQEPQQRQSYNKQNQLLDKAVCLLMGWIVILRWKGNEAGDRARMDRSRTPAGEEEAFLVHALALHVDSEKEQPKSVKRGSEVDYFSLPEALKQHYRQSMAKEWNSWKMFSAVDLIPESEIPRDAAVIPTRWVHTHKAAGEGTVLSADASTAFLQAHGIGRLLLLRPPQPCPEECVGMIMRARGSFYGTRDAPRDWWTHLRGILGSHHTQASWLDDDTCGRFVVDQNDAISSLELIAISGKSHLDSLSSPSELSKLRRVIGSVQWLARQTRFDMLCTVAMLAQRIGVATIADLKAANSMIKQLQDTPECA
eukprot:3823046-Amphidinium_carterae.2